MPKPGLKEAVENIQAQGRYIVVSLSDKEIDAITKRLGLKTLSSATKQEIAKGAGQSLFESLEEGGWDEMLESVIKAHLQ